MSEAATVLNFIFALGFFCPSHSLAFKPYPLLIAHDRASFERSAAGHSSICSRQVELPQSRLPLSDIAAAAQHSANALAAELVVACAAERAACR